MESEKEKKNFKEHNELNINNDWRKNMTEKSSRKKRTNIEKVRREVRGMNEEKEEMKVK